MADKITNKQELAVRPESDDVLYIVDVDDLTGSSSGRSKHIKMDTLLAGLPKIVTGYDGYVIIPGASSTNRYLVQTGDVLIGKGAFVSGKMMMAVAKQDTPTLDAHLDIYLQNLPGF